MKIKKGLFTTEMEISMEEIRDMRMLPKPAADGMFEYIEKQFGLSLYKKIYLIPTKEEEE